MSSWSPDSWQKANITQQPVYKDPSHVERVVNSLGSLPPLVSSWEVESLKSQLAMAAKGEAFLLQGGDCAESFAGCTPEQITAKLKILMQMSLVLVHGTRKAVIRVGRIAGQYAKPRSSNEETIDGVTLPSYRGDLVNRQEFTPEAREPDPDLMIEGYERAALTLNFIRALTESGFADLHHPENWNLDFFNHAKLKDRYWHIVGSIQDALSFMQAITGVTFEESRRAQIFTSHEALLLHYEQAQTRQVPRREGWYNLSTHMPWIGMRTAANGGAHLEYCRGIENPVGLKVGPTIDPDEVVEISKALNPRNEPGKLVLIHRMGAANVKEKLPAIIEAVAQHRLNVVWSCDPMHGNTEKTSSGFKTRRFDNILSELEQSFDVHREMGTYQGGVHFELTGEDVTECVGGARGLSESDLQRAYESQVDPRLNYEQALEMALRITDRMRSK